MDLIHRSMNSTREIHFHFRHDCFSISLLYGKMLKKEQHGSSLLCYNHDWKQTMHFLSSLKYLAVSVRLNDQSQAAGLFFCFW